MAIQFNIDEVFVMAIKIEENAAAFYRRAADLHEDDAFVPTMQELADMEDEHKRIFEEMRSGINESEKQGQTYDPFNEAILYLNTMADFHGGEGTPAVAEKLTGRESIQEIIHTGLDLEKKSILYYLGLKDLVPARLGKDKIDTIIAEEKSHIVQLTKVLTRQGI
jgi:rubrerythrin